MEYLLIIVYLIIFSFLISKLPYFQISRPGKGFLIGVFWLKTAFAIGYGVVHAYYYGHCDTFQYFDDGNILFSVLNQNPLQYLRLVLGPNNVEYGEGLKPIIEQMGFWGNNGSYAVVRFHGLVRIFSFGYYNVHAVFMAFVSFVGLVGIYRVVVSVAADRWKLLAGAIFLLPSILFFGSGLHKEGLLICAIGLILFAFISLMNKPQYARYWILLCLSSVLLFALKEFYLVALLPCLIGYLVIRKTEKYKAATFGFILIAYWAALFGAHHILPVDSLAEKIAQKQSDFMILKGNSFIEVPALEPNSSSIVKQIPGALLNTTFRPYPWEVKNLRQGIYLTESVLILILFILAICFPEKKAYRSNLLVWLSFGFSVSSFIIIGLIVPNLGAIWRYKIPALLFLLIFFTLAINWKKVPLIDKKMKSNRTY